MSEAKSAIIIGGGISGLTTAYRLKSAGFKVTLLEKSPRLGGAIETHVQNGYLTETGPNTVLETSPLVTQLIKALGLEGKKVYANETSKVRYIVRDKTPVPLPMSPPAFLKSKLFSWSAKLRLLKEPFIAAWDNSYEESLAQFVQRRLGQEFLDYAINPFVAGVYAGKPETLSVKHGLPKLYALEQKYGGLIKGQIKGAKERRQREDTAKQSARMFSFAEGLKTLPEALGTFLGRDIITQATVRDISAECDGWRVTSLGENGLKFSKTARAVIYTGPAHVLNLITLNGQPSPDLETFQQIYYPPVSILHLGFRREDVTHPLDGFGMLIPEIEGFKILGGLFSSTLFDHRAPEGQVLLTIFVGGARQPDNALESETRLLDMAMEDCRVLLGVRKDPVFTTFRTWERAIPQYEVGYGVYKKLFESLEQRYPGLFFAGCYRNGISVADTIVNGYDTAKKVQSSCRDKLN